MNDTTRDYFPSTAFGPDLYAELVARVHAIEPGRSWTRPGPLSPSLVDVIRLIAGAS